MSTFLAQIETLYVRFLSNFPPQFQPYVSIILGVVLFISIVQVLRKEFIWLIFLVVLLPASVPILKGVAQVIIDLLKLLFGVK